VAVRARGIAGDTGRRRYSIGRFFSTGDYDPARFDDQPLRPYNTGPDALLVNFKAVNIQVVPDAEGTRVRLITEPPLAAVCRS
jgi:D-alanyl-D-alanine carboxypeptidase/D-alanyl-D-alanine-endopeptidase (penicillin-binding protein 4)